MFARFMSTVLVAPSKTIRLGVIIRSPWADAGSVYINASTAVRNFTADFNPWINPYGAMILFLYLLIGRSY